MERKLASIQIIKDITPIPDADRIEVATVLGWQIVVKKNEFKVGEKVVFFEIDSCLPVGPEEYEFLRSSSYKNSPILGEVFRLKTFKMRGQISQGLILPIDVCFKDCMPLPNMDFEVGEDVTEILNIKKWEEPTKAIIKGDSKGKRPVWIEKSNETRIQSEPDLYNEFENVPYYITTKYDGSSHFIGIDENNEFHFGSHNLELKPVDKKGSFYNFIVENDLEDKLKHLKKENEWDKVYIIGEWCGEGIQKNKLQLKKPCWYPFTVNIDGKHMGLYATQDMCEMLNVSMVEIEETGNNLCDTYKSIDELLNRASENRKHVYPGQCEGIVIRPITPTYSPTIRKYLSMKVINNNYLMK